MGGISGIPTGEISAARTLAERSEVPVRCRTMQVEIQGHCRGVDAW